MPFDIASDELDILLAESEEHLQTLDEGLVQLEQTGNDPELLQAIFRAAHTLKGSAGVIGHWRMADLTHALETVLDSLRKGLLAITPPIVDVSLEALDALRLLHGELVHGESSPVDIDPLVTRLLSFSQAASAPAVPDPKPPLPTGPNGNDPAAPGFTICADIAPECIAPAARAFQVVLALQALGELYDLQPPLAVIESAAPVRRVTARIVTPQPFEAVARALTLISDLKQIWIDEREVEAASGETLAVQALAASTLERARPHVVEKTIRTSVERLDTLMNLVGELITDRNRLQQIRGDFENRLRDHESVDNLAQTILHISRITDQLQDEVMRIRMLPVANVFNKFPRVVRDLARKAGKQLELVVRGADTELDRSVIEEISDPLLHLLRNAVDHGLETPDERLAAGKSERGLIVLTARHEEGHILLTVEDDGRGIDPAKVTAAAIRKGLLSEAEAATLSRDEALNLIFAPGLSTATSVSDVSGRGVGMDIVRTNIERLNGQIRVETWLGQGARFQITLPLTLATIPTLLVSVGDGIYALPLMAVMEALRLPVTDWQTIGGQPVLRVRERVLPLVRLAEVLGLPTPPAPRAFEYAVVVRWGNLDMALLVDALVGEQELVVKSLGAILTATRGVSGAAILGDGRVALIADMAGVFACAGQLSSLPHRENK